ncbi:MAG: cyclic nucleotide-binding domain-containing protein [Phycisphaerales bacterium]|nr:cyclic nucleotide-binding domain-containing protein [Phycisphaerales bacterium]
MTGLKADWASHPIFEGLAPDCIEIFARTAKVEEFEPRDLIFHEGEEADRFYLVLEGTVVIQIFVNERGPVNIETVGCGEVLGWSWLVEPYRWHFDAQATVPTKLIAFNARRVRESFESRPDFGFALMKRFLPVIVQRLQATRLQLLDVYDVPS